MILHKEMKKLYLNKYQYKVVLVLDAAWLFRGNNLERAKEQIFEIREAKSPSPYIKIFDTDLVLNLIDVLESIEDYTVRVERCYLSLYFTEDKHIRTIKKLMGSHVKEIYEPKIPLSEGTVVSSLPYDYKVHVKLNHSADYSAFVEWAADNSKLRLPSSSKLALIHETWYNMVYFYVSGEKQLTLARLHLGSGIRDRKSTRLNSSHTDISRMPSSA